MVNISILVLCAILLKASATDPQVYEDVDDQMQIESNTRIVRDPFNQPKPRLLQPQAFQFSATTQQDPRKTRYMQQQLVDLKNLLRNRFMNGPTRGRSSDLVRSSSTINENYQASDEKNNGTIRKTVTSRKLRPSSYFEDQGEKIKRQDSNHIIYVNPEHIRDDSEEGLKALNALVGQNPNHQLEGLKRLLGTQPSNLVLPLIKGPYPTAIPNHSKLEASVSIDDLQAELDEAAQAQLTDALAHAQQQALAHVEAQHQAIAKAKEDAQKKALAQIALHNQGIKAENLPHPLALRLKQEVVPAPLYAPHHFHHNQAEEVAQIPINPNLKKISITKTHSITALQSPTTYQQAVLETQPEKHHHLGDADSVDDHQYAARYAFGYKIRDAKMGNDFGHEEKRDGENAKGIYHVLLPDGRMQKVEYYVDPSGYHAKVTYENLAHH